MGEERGGCSFFLFHVSNIVALFCLNRSGREVARFVSVLF